MPEEHSENSAREQQVNEVISAYLAALAAGQKPNPQEWLARLRLVSDGRSSSDERDHPKGSGWPA